MDYAALKVIHVSCAAMSYALFVTRGVWMMEESKRLQQRWVKVAPHAVDTLLLASAIAMAAASRQYPLAAPWLTAKVVALVIYIVLGMVALKRGRTRRVRVAAWITAQAVFIYIVAVAVTRNPLAWS